MDKTAAIGSEEQDKEKGKSLMEPVELQQKGQSQKKEPQKA